MDIYCANCEQPCSADAAFCPTCGHQLAAATHIPPDVVQHVRKEAADALPVKTCPGCQQLVPGSADQCETCGYMFAPDTPREHAHREEPSVHQVRTSGYATASFICGLLCLFCGGLPLGIVALVLGETANKEIAQHPGMGGQRMASAGRVLGIIGIIGGVVMLAVYLSLLA